MSKGLTPSQTIGPFYFGTLIKAYKCELAPAGVAGERIELVLSLHDAKGEIVPDGLIEIWQANSHGRYNHPDDRRNLPLDAGFEGFGRASTDDGGRAHFSTRVFLPMRTLWRDICPDDITSACARYEIKYIFPRFRSGFRMNMLVIG